MTTRLPVVTVTYSPGDHLRSFVETLPAATTRQVGLVMADNGSTDGVPEEVAAEYGFAEFFPTGDNLGYGTAINRAVTLIAGRPEDFDQEFVLVVNPDVTFEPGSVDELLAAAARWPRAAAFGPRISETDGSVYPSARAVPRLGAGIGHALLGQVWPRNPWTAGYLDDADMETERAAGWLSGSCLLLRRAAFDALGGFDERYFMYLEDIDLGDRLGRAGWQNVYVPAAVIHHDQGHAANAVPEFTLRAHHRSAYLFQADRHPYAWQAPIRWALRAGLELRCRLAIRSTRRAAG
ncbi:glycosyltransferase family 2 protein [Dietzia maris]|nr:glycosyltransferase family 2 protein [Dietzia maris]MBB0997780.1 glycosyltransferase family 2 protein [Dietzia maris]